MVEPRALITIDGRTRKTTLYLQPRNERREQRMLGPGLSPGAEAAHDTGIDLVLPRDDFAAAVTGFAGDRRSIYTPFRPEVLGEASSSDPAALWRATKADPWDGRVSREGQFVQKLKASAPQCPVADLDPIVDALRVMKSAREIAVIREATRITGLGISISCSSSGAATCSASTPSSTRSRAPATRASGSSSSIPAAAVLGAPRRLA